MTDSVDVLITGAGAAGMMCALTAAQRGRSVLLLDHSAKLAEKIRISGGGRCNFTNRNAKPENYISNNPHFCRSALARFTPQHFIAMLDKHGIGYHEKTLGQLFCDGSARQVVDLLLAECAKGKAMNLGGWQPRWVDFHGAKGHAGEFSLNAHANTIRRIATE